MDVHELVVIFMACFSALESIGKLVSGALYAAQFLAVTIQFSRYSNALRVQRVLLLNNAVDEQLIRLLSTSSLPPTLSISQAAEALLGIQADLEGLLELLQACGQRPLWVIIYGSSLDALLTDFERVLTSNGPLWVIIYGSSLDALLTEFERVLTSNEYTFGR